MEAAGHLLPGEKAVVVAPRLVDQQTVVAVLIHQLPQQLQQQQPQSFRGC
jgi:hypothetical protein